jgi:hypothetical protein
MSTGVQEKSVARKAVDVSKGLPLGDKARQLLSPELTPSQYFDRLLAGQHYLDAVRFVARDLPKRQAVAWGCQCVRRVAGTQPPPLVESALGAAEKWVADPSEANRRATMSAAEAAGFGTSAGSVAVAAFWSGGSLGPAKLAAIPPAEDLTAKAVASAVMLAAVQTEPEKGPEKYRWFLAQAAEVLKSIHQGL